MFRLNRFALSLTTLLSVGCASMDSESTFAPTGAKGILDDFGRTLYLDEECGGLDSVDYPEFYQNALLRDGDVNDGTLWLVDGSHLWSAALAPDPDSDVTLKMRLPFVGHGNAVAAAQRYLAVATVERGVTVFPGYNLKGPVYIDHIERAIDVDAQNDRLAIAAGEAGVLIYDMTDPVAPVLAHTITTGAFASGVRWSADENDATLYFSACRFTGYVKFDGDAATPVVSAPLSHTNAKDAHGNGHRMAVANNGGGVWFYEMDDMEQSSIYEVLDPNFYANAAFVIDDFAYVAAGNREIVSLWIYGDYKPEPKAVLPKDPLGVTVGDGIVYGFGNFRDIGERTVVRTTTLDGTPGSVRDFQKGLLPWLEPQRHSLWFTDATNREWLVRREVDGYHVYNAALLERSWQPAPEYKFYFVHGTYAVSVTADNMIRIMAAGAITAQTIGQWPDPFPPRAYVLRSDIEGPELKLVWAEDDVEYFFIGPEAVIVGGSLTNQNADPTEDLCLFSNNQQEGGFSTTFIAGQSVVDDVEITWCSRLVDPYIPGNRLAADVGSSGKACLGNQCVSANAFESGVVGVVPLSEEQWIGIVDDRSAYTTSLVLWHAQTADEFVAETASLMTGDAPQFKLAEQHRYVRLGRPDGWQALPDNQVRVWMNDGSAFTYDIASNLVYDEIAPLDK